ncbi:SE-domain-containing protein [Fistulina hepatica ATCC 64428]|uniref:Squalene monooxygenase n=1 Tax=Fistulina hepatica ATCC 64428 TaxID=1128425 RepID=A0A0D7A740_9AGAR|nr:SE-domain-containing protein [Fistulina hepatica ATCC 64428]
MACEKQKYDVVIVGAGVVGCTTAYRLATHPALQQTPLRIAIVERNLGEPDRIVGELLQPGGKHLLERLGMAAAFDNIDAAPTNGYCVLDCTRMRPGEDTRSDAGTIAGIAFHHGRFIMRLRELAAGCPNVDLFEGTVADLVEADFQAGHVRGVRYSSKGAADGMRNTLLAPLTIVADGCFSNFRERVMGTGPSHLIRPTVRSHFVGMVVRGLQLPHAQHGTVCLIAGQGPVLLYQIDSGKRFEHRWMGLTGTRMLVDVRAPFPADLKAHIAQHVVPGLPADLRAPILETLDDPGVRLRRMPNSFMPGAPQHEWTLRDAPFPLNVSKTGVILMGDAYNMRHPLTGGGMLCCFEDVLDVSDSIADVIKQTPAEALDDWEKINRDVLMRWYFARKPLTATVNILSVALYDLFGAEDRNLAVLRRGCFRYFERGGRCTQEPVGILAGLYPRPLLLMRHFFTVAFYAICVMFREGDVVSGDQDSGESYPRLLVRSVSVFWTACVVFLPLLWTEVRWWTPRQVGE